MKNFNQVLEVARRLNSAASKLSIDTIVTEQYPKGLLHTSEPLKSELVASDSRQCKIFEKTKFSMVVEEVCPMLRGKTMAIVCGIETHVCVMQTCLDLIECGIQPFLCVDGCDSRSALDKEIALKRLEKAGVILATHEMVIFELLGDKNHEQFTTTILQKNIIHVFQMFSGCIIIKS